MGGHNIVIYIVTIDTGWIEMGKLWNYMWQKTWAANCVFGFFFCSQWS